MEVWKPLVQICSIFTCSSELGPAAFEGLLGDWHHGMQTRLHSREYNFRASTEHLLGPTLHRYGGILGCLGNWKDSIERSHLCTCFPWTFCVPLSCRFSWVMSLILNLSELLLGRTQCREHLGIHRLGCPSHGG